MQQLLQRIKGDKMIWSIVVLLSLWSMLAVYSATRSIEWRNDRDYVMKHVAILFLGLIIVYFVHRINYTKFARFSVILFLLSIPLLIYTLTGAGTTINDGARWIRIPVAGITFQTSDLAKLAIFTFLARQLSKKQNVIKDFRNGFLPVLLPVLIICGLIAPANLSTALLLGVTCCIMFFIGRVDIRHIALLAGIGFAGVILLFVASKTFGFGRGATWEKRIENFMGEDDEKKDPDANFQTDQANIAIASGGIIGRGPGNSWARDFLPHPYSDFIFAIIIEEYGLIGGALLIALYVLFLWRSIQIFRRCPYAFGAFLALGLSFTLVFQAMINMAVNVHLLPVTGLTLPLVSMGGSSIWFTSIAIGIILSVSRYVDEMEGKESIQTQKEIKKADA